MSGCHRLARDIKIVIANRNSYKHRLGLRRCLGCIDGLLAVLHRLNKPSSLLDPCQPCPQFGSQCPQLIHLEYTRLHPVDMSYVRRLVE